MKDELAKAIHGGVVGWINRKRKPEYQMNAALDWRGVSGECREMYRNESHAVHSFLGVEKGKELGPGAWATMVEGIRWGIERCDAGPDRQTCVGCDALPENAVDDAAICPLQAALRAAGEEVSDGG